MMTDRSKGLRRPSISSDRKLARRLQEPAKHGARPWQITLASTTLVVMLALLVLLTFNREWIAERLASPLADKLAGAERIAYYIVPERDHARVPTFRLTPNDTSIKLITHLVLPSGTPYDSEQDYAYGIHLQLTELDGEPIWEHELNIRTRQSKSEGDVWGWRYENSFLLDDPQAGESGLPRELTDDRLTRVRLPEGKRDRLLKLTFIPREPNVGVQALARAYVQRPRAGDDRALRELALDPSTARDLVDHLTYRDWAQLTEDERLTRLSVVWERLAAEGEAGVDYELLSIYETGFRLVRHSKTDKRRLAVDDARWLAVNVLGPAELTIEVFDPPIDLASLPFADSLDAATDFATGPRQRPHLDVRRYGLDGSGETYPSSRAKQRTIEVPAGVHTLIISSKAPLELTLEVAEAQDDRVWLIEADRPKRVTDDDREVLEPDVRRIQVAWAGDNWKVRPRWAIVGPDDVVSRIFRFDIRVVHPLASMRWVGGGVVPDVELCFLDGEGEQLGCDRWDGQPAIASRFEGLRLGDDTPGPTGQLDTRWYVVSEPQSFRVVAPPRAKQIELRAVSPGQRLIVRGYGFWPEAETTLGEPFREYVHEQTIWRYPPLDTRTWFPVRPVNYDDLQDDKAVADLLAQVRLQPRGLDDGSGDGVGGGRWDGDPSRDNRLANARAGADGWDAGPWVTLDPRGIHRRRMILEQLDPEAANRLADRWDGSLFTELWPNRSLVADFSATGPGAPELHWQVDPRTLGRNVTLTIDGQRFEHRIEETRGRWRLPIESGRRRVSLSFDASNQQYEMWLDRPVLVASPPVSRRRVVNELTNELVFPLVKPSNEALTVNVVVYLARRRERAELALSLDRGEPKRRTGVPIDRLSLADRSYTIDTEGAHDERDRMVDARSEIRFVDLEARQGVPLDTATITITLGEDVVPGNHEVRVRLLDGGRVWIRAFHRGVADRSKSAASWTEAVPQAAPGDQSESGG